MNNGKYFKFLIKATIILFVLVFCFAAYEATSNNQITRAVIAKVTKSNNMKKDIEVIANTQNQIEKNINKKKQQTSNEVNGQDENVESDVRNS